MARTHNLRNAESITDWGNSRSGRYLQSIRRQMDLSNELFRNRRRNEEVLSLSYQDGQTLGGGADWERVREYALNLPYRQVRWIESQATSKKILVEINRDAGKGQLRGGPGDEETGMWLGICLGRVLHEANARRELRSLIGEVMPRGTSVLRIGYHEEAVTVEEAQEAGKDPQSVVADVLMEDDRDARKGQDHARLSEGLGEIAQSEEFQLAAGQQATEAVLARKQAHDAAAEREGSMDHPIQSTRMIRRRIWVQKRRVGENVGWAPWVCDTEDTPFWWERHTWTVAEVKKSSLFTASFKREVEGYDGRDVTEVGHGGRMPSTESMGSDARQAQTEDILDDDERIVEWYEIWVRRPDMPSGGVRLLVCPEFPDKFIHASDANPHVDDDGYGVIPGFYPYFDFTPYLSSLTVPERTCGIPPIGAGMTQFEKLAEYNRLRHESALRHSLRVYQIDPALADNKTLLNGLRNGEDGLAYVAKEGMRKQNGDLRDGVMMLQFTGNTQEIDRQAIREESDWTKMAGMPPAVLQGMGTAETATQDRQGIAAGERESGALITYLEERMADVVAGIRGLMRANYDDEDYTRLLGEEGAAVMKAWAQGSVDDGDEIEVFFGTTQIAKEEVHREQLMKAIGVVQAQTDPITGISEYDSDRLIEELYRSLNVGAPQKNEGLLAQLQQMLIQMAAQIQQLTGENPLDPSAGGGGGQQGPRPGGPSAPTPENLQAGAVRGTLPSEEIPAGI